MQAITSNINSAEHGEVNRVLEKPQTVKGLLNNYEFDYNEAEYYLWIGGSTMTEGWILHISVIKVQLTDLLLAVLPLLREVKVPFKVVKDHEIARGILNGDLGVGTLGKMIAIFAENQEKLVFLAKQLIMLTHDFKGPAIPTDYFLGGAIYASYGPTTIPFVLQKGTNWPFSDLCPYTPMVKRKLWSYKYRPLSVIKNDFKGRVIKGNYFKSLFSIQFCLIKEGVKNIWVDETGRDSTDRLLWQYELYKDLAGHIPTPHIFDLFQEMNNTYLVMEFINGDSLSHKVGYIYDGGNWFSLSAAKKLELVDCFLRILDAIQLLHEKGYVHRDITPANFLIDKKGNIYLIDMELAYSLSKQKPTPPFALGTPGFMSPEQRHEQVPTVKEDIYAIGALMIQLFTGLSPEKIDPFSKDPSTDLGYFTSNERIISLITSCLNKYPTERPDISLLDTEIRAFRQEVASPESQHTPSPPDKAQLERVINRAIRGLTHPNLLAENHVWKSFNRQYEAAGTPPIEQAAQPGFYDGISGILYFLASAKKAGFDISPCLAGYQESWNYIHTNWLNDPSQLKTGLFEGQAGISLALQEGMCANLLNKETYQGYLRSCFSGTSTENNLAAGVSGQLIALLRSRNQLDPAFFRQKSEHYAGILLEQQNNDGSWNLFRKENEKMIGLSHGVAGVLYALLAYAAYHQDQQTTHSIEKGLHWLMKNANNRQGKIYWNTTTKSKSIDFWSSGIGIPGIALTFLKAYELTKELRYFRIAETALIQLPTEPVYKDFGQIHGLSGVGEVYLEANRILKGKEWQKRLNWLAGLFIHTSLGRDKGYWAMNNYANREAELLTGASGVAHFLIRYTQPENLTHLL